MHSRRRKRTRYHYKKRRRNWWPWVVFIAVSALFFWAVFQFFLVLFSNVRSETISVELNVEKGRAEFLLPDNSEWNPAFSEQKFLEGDSIRTAKNSRIGLRFLETNEIFLDQNTELKIVELTQKSSGKTQAIFELTKGQIWAQIDDQTLSTDEDSQLLINTDRTQTAVRGTTFNINSNAESDTITLVKGQVSVNVFGSNNKSRALNVGVGQVLEVNEGTFDLVERGGETLSAIEAGFEESPWYIDNLERQSPEAAAVIRERIRPPAPPEPTPEEILEESPSALEFFESLEVDSQIEAPVITEPAEGASIGANVDLVPIKGTAPAEAFQIQVNDYVLQRFEPGDRKWTYIAAAEYSTLRPGANQYNVVAITREGKRSPITTLNINYEGASPQSPPATEETEANTDTKPSISNADLRAPIVNRPALFAADPAAVYETSASVVTFAGEVDPATQAVEVNGFRLRRFNPGDTNFSYIANATYGNMREGENTYTIRAFDTEGKTVDSQIKIFYRPLNLE